MEAAVTYADLQRYDGAVVERGHRDGIRPCVLQPRDIELIRDVWRLRFLTASQLLELHWPGRAEQVGRRGLAKLFHAGHLDRFRPITRSGGSFPGRISSGRKATASSERSACLVPGPAGTTAESTTTATSSTRCTSTPGCSPGAVCSGQCSCPGRARRSSSRRSSCGTPSYDSTTIAASRGSATRRRDSCVPTRFSR